MARVVIICFRRNIVGKELAEKLELLNSRLFPDNLQVDPPVLHLGDRCATMVIGATPTVLIKEGSACLGKTLAQNDDWWKPGTGVPDGAFALFRSDAGSVELLTDIVASRTIWYSKTEDAFIASSSQRAIVHLLKGFQPNPDAFAWMLSAGTLGPDNSWDIRVRRLEPDSRLLLDRVSWTLKITRGEVHFEPIELPQREQMRRLLRALEDTFHSLNYDSSQWTLLLSGGYDSRAILLMLKNKDGLPCVTWGLASSLNDKSNDAFIARELAHYHGLEHAYMETNTSSDGFDKTVMRYLRAGEGRVDHISGYMDGLDVWRRLHEQKRNVIRGDEPFGKYHVDNDFEARDCVALRLLSDCRDLRCLDYLPTQRIPDYLQRRRGESLDTWRDRLNQQYELPTVWAALNEVKCAYVELTNPLISRKSVDVVRSLPDALRTEKKLFKEMVRAISPPIPFAERAAIQLSGDILRERGCVTMLLDVLKSNDAERLLSRPLIRHLCENVQIIDSGGKRDKRDRMVSSIKHLVPDVLRRGIKRMSPKPVADMNILAFRAFIICKMCRMLSEDGAALATLRTS